MFSITLPSEVKAGAEESSKITGGDHWNKIRRFKRENSARTKQTSEQLIFTIHKNEMCIATLEGHDSGR